MSKPITEPDRSFLNIYMFSVTTTAQQNIHVRPRRHSNCSEMQHKDVPSIKAYSKSLLIFSETNLFHTSQNMHAQPCWGGSFEDLLN